MHHWLTVQFQCAMFAHQSPLVRARLSKELLTPTFALSTTPTLSSSRPPSPPPPESSWIFRHLKHRNTRMSDRRQTLDSLFVLDFEATCDQPRQTRPQEIIEFPCIKLRLAPGGGSGSAAPVPPMETARFHRYVRPVVHPHISDFCTELTGITQDMVENEEDFATTFRFGRTTNSFNFEAAKAEMGEHRYVENRSCQYVEREKSAAC